MPEQPLQPREEARWLGMHHDDNAKMPLGVSLFLQNVYPDDGRYKGRTGTVQLGSQLASAKVQGIVHFQELDGTVHILAFCNGDMFEYNEGTDSWSTTDLSAQGITIDPSASLSFANSRGRLIVTDGVNQPFMWDGATTFTTLSNAPVANGVCIYYDKVFFYDIPGSQERFDWSNEADPETGYNAEGNSWEFAQTDTGRIVGMTPLNNVLVVFKEDSAAWVRGAVNEQFQTDAVREGLSETEGLIGLRGETVLDGDVFFVSQQGPRAASGGQRLLKITDTQEGDNRLEDTWNGLTRSSWSDVLVVLDTERRHVLWFFPSDDTVIGYAVDEDGWFTFDFPWTVTAVGHVEFLTGQEYVLIGDDSGNVYQYGDSSLQSDDGTAIERIIRSRQHGLSSSALVKRLSEVRLFFDLQTDVTFQLRPMTDGSVGSASNTSLTTASEGTGRHTYRKGFNAVARAVGWELYQNQSDEDLLLEGSLTLITRVGSYADIGNA